MCMKSTHACVLLQKLEQSIECPPPASAPYSFESGFLPEPGAPIYSVRLKAKQENSRHPPISTLSRVRDTGIFRDSWVVMSCWLLQLNSSPHNNREKGLNISAIFLVPQTEFLKLALAYSRDTKSN